MVSSVEFLEGGDSASAVMLVRYLTMTLSAAKSFAKEMHAARDA